MATVFGTNLMALPDQTYQKVAIFGLGVCALINIYSTQPLLLDIAREFEIKKEQATWTIGATTLGIAIVAPLAGVVSDHLGRKRVMVSAVALLALVTFCSGLSGSFGMLLAYRFMQGLLIPFIFAVAVAYISEEWPGRAAASMNSIYVAGTAFGGFCGRFLSGAVASIAPWRSTCFVLAVIPLLVLIAIFKWLPRERNFKSSPTLLGGLRDVRHQFGDWRFIGTCFIGASLLFQQVVSFTYCGLLLMTPPFGLTSIEVGAVFAVFLIAAVVTPLAGHVAGHFGKKTTFLMSSALGISGLALTLIPNISVVVIGLALSCISVFAGQVFATSYAAEQGAGSRSTRIGFYLTAYYAGGSFGAVLPGPFYLQFGWVACVLLVWTVTAASMSIATLAWRGGRT
jgi:MFS transporter, YNFM family, putative membrane transport protein